jgi:hypothetical protein
MPLPLALLAPAVSGLFKVGMGIFQNAKANKITPIDATYKTSQFARDQYGLAKQYLNSRMPGASQQEQNILASQGNTLANYQRNAGDSGQALALAAATQGQTNQSFADMGVNEAQNKQAMLGNFNQAAGVMIGEGDKVYQDTLRKYNNAVQEKSALRNAAWQNIGAGVNGLTGMAAQYGGEIGKLRMKKGFTPTMGLADLASGPNTMGAFGKFQAPGNYNPSWLK